MPSVLLWFIINLKKHSANLSIYSHRFFRTSHKFHALLLQAWFIAGSWAGERDCVPTFVIITVIYYLSGTWEQQVVGRRTQISSLISLAFYMPVLLIMKRIRHATGSETIEKRFLDWILNNKNSNVITAVHIINQENIFFSRS